MTRPFWGVAQVACAVLLPVQTTSAADPLEPTPTVQLFQRGTGSWERRSALPAADIAAIFALGQA